MKVYLDTIGCRLNQAEIESHFVSQPAENNLDFEPSDVFEFLDSQIRFRV